MSRGLPNLDAMVRMAAEFPPSEQALPGVSPQWLGRTVRTEDGEEHELDGVVLGGYFDGAEFLALAAGIDPERIVIPKVRGVRDELMRRIHDKIDRATGAVVWLLRPTVADENGYALRHDADRDRWTFFFRAYFYAPGVERTLVECGPIEFVRAPGT